MEENKIDAPKFDCDEFVTMFLRFYILLAPFFAFLGLFCGKNLYLVFFSTPVSINVFAYWYRKKTKNICENLLNLSYVNTAIYLSFIYKLTPLSHVLCVFASAFAIYIVSNHCKKTKIMKKRKQRLSNLK